MPCWGIFQPPGMGFLTPEISELRNFKPSHTNHPSKPLHCHCHHSLWLPARSQMAWLNPRWPVAGHAKPWVWNIYRSMGWLIFMVHVGKYTIHGSYGIGLPTFSSLASWLFGIFSVLWLHYDDMYLTFLIAKHSAVEQMVSIKKGSLLQPIFFSEAHHFSIPKKWTIYYRRITLQNQTTVPTIYNQKLVSL